jgi:SRSO17 transposase
MIRRSWTRPASIEETLALWAASLREIKKRIRPLFNQDRVARNAGLFLEGLLGDEQRKTGWMRAEAAGDPGPWRQQAILGRRDWDADALRDIVRDGRLSWRPISLPAGHQFVRSRATAAKPASRAARA